jgi:hypothetical protein
VLICKETRLFLVTVSKENILPSASTYELCRSLIRVRGGELKIGSVDSSSSGPTRFPSKKSTQLMTINKLILEEFYLLRYNAMQSTERQLTFRSNTSPPSSEMKSKSNKKHGARSKQSSGLLFNPEYGGHMFLRNVGRLSSVYKTLYHRRENLKLCKFMFHGLIICNLFCSRKAIKLN